MEDASDQCGRILWSRMKKHRFLSSEFKEELLKVVAKLEKIEKDRI